MLITMFGSVSVSVMQIMWFALGVLLPTFFRGSRNWLYSTAGWSDSTNGVAVRLHRSL